MSAGKGGMNVLSDWQGGANPQVIRLCGSERPENGGRFIAVQAHRSPAGELLSLCGRGRRFNPDCEANLTVRAAISEFSGKAQRRLLDRARGYSRAWCHSIAAGELWFITPSYGRDVPDVEGAKMDLHRFRVRMARAYPAAWGLWVMEFQQPSAARGWKSGTHFHCVVANPAGGDWSDWLRANWLEVSGDNGSAHWARVQHGCDVQRVSAAAGLPAVMQYLAGEVGKSAQKVAQGVGPPGRYWGVINRRASGAAHHPGEREFVDAFAWSQRLMALSLGSVSDAARVAAHEAEVRRAREWLADTGEVKPILDRVDAPLVIGCPLSVDGYGAEFAAGGTAGEFIPAMYRRACLLTRGHPDNPANRAERVWWANDRLDEAQERFPGAFRILARGR